MGCWRIRNTTTRTAVKNFLLENGIPIPEGNFIGSNEKAIWEALVPNDPVRRQEMLMAYREYRKARPTPYDKLTDPQAEPLMNALRSRGLKVAVASSSAAPDIMKMLTEGGREGDGGFRLQRRGLRRPLSLRRTSISRR